MLETIESRHHDHRNVHGREHIDGYSDQARYAFRRRLETGLHRPLLDPVLPVHEEHGSVAAYVHHRLKRHSERTIAFFESQCGLGVHARHEHQTRIGHIHLGLHRASGVLHSPGEARDSSQGGRGYYI